MHLRRFLHTLLLTGLAFATIAGIHGYRFLHTPVAPPAEVRLTIAPGAAFGSVARQLERQGVIASHRLFTLWARWHGQTTAIQAGRYRFVDETTPTEVLDRLCRGDVELANLTLPEGLTLREVAQRVEAAGVGRADRFLALARDPAVAKRLGINAPTLEGYLFPETYRFVPETDEEGLLRMMVAQQQRQWTPELQERLRELSWSEHQLLTLASIVQKEAGNLEEMPLIAAVFHNRLRRGMRLQADPTVIYGLGESFDGNLTRRDLLTDTPYNSYTRGGLPPGPIANPGAAALQAAAWPADVPYLYFVARRDGTHYFSRTLVEHNAAVRRYQLRRRSP